MIAPPEQVLLSKSPDGDDVLKPITDKIRALRDRDLLQPGPSQPGSRRYVTRAAWCRPKRPPLRPEWHLRRPAWQPAPPNICNPRASRSPIPATPISSIPIPPIIDYTGKPYTLKYLVDTLKISPNYIFSRYDPTSQVDVVLILGQDWAVSNPMP